ncbi:hypothetical protein GCM10010460_28810 [Microbacterium terrae]|nr:hypothetical protein GCM10017594_28610 [Microbacterium terrae]
MHGGAREIRPSCRLGDGEPAVARRGDEPEQERRARHRLGPGNAALRDAVHDMDATTSLIHIARADCAPTHDRRRMDLNTRAKEHA